MLHEFLTENRAEILRRARSKVAERPVTQAKGAQVTEAIASFLDELVNTLKCGLRHSDAINHDAATHGGSRQRAGFPVADVVRDYGDICQVVTQLADELRTSIGSDEFRTLNQCLDDAIAEAVSEHARVHAAAVSHDEAERLSFLAHELRNALHLATLSFEILKTGSVGIGGSTGAVLGRSLASIRSLVNRALTEVRLNAGAHDRKPLLISSLLEEIEAEGAITSKDRGMDLIVERADTGVIVEADRQLLSAAVFNLLQNAFKFSREHGHVRLRTSATPERVLIEVEDECGGLRVGQIDELFAVPQQSGVDKSGLGLGLMISKRAVAAMGGALTVRNNGQVGCVFTIDMPRLQNRS